MTRATARKVQFKIKGNTPDSPFAKAVDELQNVLDGIPDQPSLKLMTFDEVKQKVTKGKGPSKRSNTYRAIGDKLAQAQQMLTNATLDGVTKAGGPAKYGQQFDQLLDELTTQIELYQKHHKGKKAKAIEPLLGEVKSLRAKMPDVLAALSKAQNKGFDKDTSIEKVSNFQNMDEALTKALGKSTFKSLTLAELNQKGADKIEQAILQELNALEGTLDTSKPGGKELQARLQQIKQDIKKDLSDMLVNLTNPPADQFPTDLKIADAVQLVRVHVDPAQLKGVCGRFCNFSEFNPDTETGPKSNLGSGACNTVQLVPYEDGKRVFKEEQTTDTKSQAMVPSMIGIDKANDPRYGNRNVASGLVGNLLGTDVIVKTSFALTKDANDNAQVGLLMEKSNGKSLQKALNSRSVADDKDLPWKGKLSPKALASLQKQLADLECCDILSGQMDRHPGNYMIEVDGDKVVVKGIDNDFAFGSVNITGDKVPATVMGFTGIRNMPRLISQEVATKVQGQDFDRDVAPQFAGLLKTDEIKEAKLRFEALQKHVAKLVQDKCVVTDWETWRSPDGKTASEFLGDKKGDSFFSRDIKPYMDLLEKANK